MRNSYPGICYRCNKKVDSGQGHFEIIPKKQRIDGIKWRFQHAHCAIFFRGTNVGNKINKEKSL